ncbi:NAD(P)H-hydrate dehydratase [Maritalea sp.]|uniref:NAD(P)H-hydrate dehydratase n=1 Tax=Maritalea sp. TaxID=2003361 RepID=UPI003EF6B63F
MVEFRAQLNALLCPEEMGQADRLAISTGISEVELMRNAGHEVVQYIVSHFRRAPITVLCGPGNNGGDGFVVAVALRQRGWPVRLAQWGEIGRYSSAATAFISQWGEIEAFEPCMISDASLIVDALFGAGLDRPVSGEIADIVRLANDANVPKISIDMPTGVDGRTGNVLGCAVKADATVTFFRKKPGHLLFPGRELCGELAVCQIGIPDIVLTNINPTQFENGPNMWCLPEQTFDGHKYDRGHCLVVCGGPLATGASRLSAMSALRVGAGLVSLCGENDALAEHAAHVTDVMLKPDTLDVLLEDKRYNVIVVGPGNGVSELTCHNVLTALAAGRALVLDADALTSFKSDPIRLFDAIKNSSCENVVMTPHMGEFTRLFPNLDAREDKVEAAKEAAKRSGATVLLKGADTVIARPDGRAVINANAPPWMGTAGSGDVLAGIVGGLLAQGMEAFDAACAAVYVHGLAGRQFGGAGMIASDLPQLLPNARGAAQEKLTLS